jgi:hypothetical protein
MSLEKIVKKTSKLLPLALVAPILSCQKSCSEQKNVPHFEVKYAITDSNGEATFVDDQNNENVTIYVKSENSSGSGVADALVVFFDGDGSEAYYSEHPDYNTPAFEIYEHNSSHTLVLTGTTWVGWSVEAERNEDLHASSRQFVDWATKEKNNGWGYYGCTTFTELEEGRKLATVLYASAKQLGLVAAVNSFSATIQEVLEIFVGELETKEAKECEAFQFFGFIPNIDGWVSPTGGIVIPYCYTPASTETYTDNGVDDDCDGIIDEGGSSEHDDSGNSTEDDTGNNYSNIICSSSAAFCDDFEDGVFDSTKWYVYDVDTGSSLSSLPEENGRLQINGHYKVYTEEFDTPLASDEYSINLESKIYPSSEFYLNAYLPGTSSGITVTGDGSKVSAYCFENDGEEETMSANGDIELEIKVSQNHSSVYVNDNLLLSQNDCMNEMNTSSIGRGMQVVINNKNSGDLLELDYLLVEKFVGD